MVMEMTGQYKDLTKWYDYVEQFVGISGQAENWPLLPDGNFYTYGFKLCEKIS
jgi:hypothetical protein